MLRGKVRDRWRALFGPGAGPLGLVMLVSMAMALPAAFSAATQLRAGQDQPRQDSQVQQVVYTSGSGGAQLKWLPRATQTVTLASRPAPPARVTSMAPQTPPSTAAALPPAGQALGQSAAGTYPAPGLPTMSTAQAGSDPFADPFDERSGTGTPGSGTPTLPRPLPPVRGDESLGAGLPDGLGGVSTEVLPAEPVPRPFSESPQPGTEPYGLESAQPAGSAAGQPSQTDTVAGSGQTGYVFGPAGVKFHCPSPQDKDFYTPLEDLSVDISPPDADQQPLPPECTVGDETLDAGLPRSWVPVTFTWKASGLCHKPLYFQQRHVERYGHSWGPLFQPVMSHANFYASVIALPYKMGLTPPNECQYTLGFYRPNSCAPYMLDPLPLSVRAGLWEAGAWVGGVLLMP